MTDHTEILTRSSDPEYIHLHVHTEFSLTDSTIRIKQLIQSCIDANMPAVAITDNSNLFALIKFYKMAIQAGIKPIAGMDVLVVDENQDKTQVVFLCQNQTGYLNLSKLISRAYQENQDHQGIVAIQQSWISEYAEGLIVLINGSNGKLSQHTQDGELDKACDLLQFWCIHFKNRLYLEVTRTDKASEQWWVPAAAKLGEKLSLPLLASNDIRFIQAEDFEVHEARVCINQKRVLDDPKRPRDYTEEQYFKSVDQMKQLFSDLPGALQNSVEIAKRCNLTLSLGKYYLPAFPVPEGMDENSFIAAEAENGLKQRILESGIAPDHTEQDYFDRLKVELDVIIQMGFPGYFLIVAEIIQWAKKEHIPVGPGRGSGAGSIVAWAMRITDLDPLRYELLFERFLNPERVSMPDFDIDICMDKRGELIHYISDHYGKEQVSQIVTFGTMAAKAAVKDCGRVMGMPFPVVEGIAKEIPNRVGIKLTEAFEESAELAHCYQHDEEAKDLLDLALKLEGLARNTGKHAGGVVISPTHLTDFTPLCCDEIGGDLISQYDKDDVESAGLVKFDFLGLKTLTIIDWTLNYLKDIDIELDIDQLPLDDEQSYSLLQAALTTGVFQLESPGMKGVIYRLQPDCFDDLVALVALYRPGPLGSGMVGSFIDRKHGREKVEYAHPELEPILSNTYGIILYQEQVMQIAQTLASYSLGGADLLRRAMGKKKAEEMQKQRAIFLKGAEESKVNPKTAASIFDQMESFAEYGFNKSHSAAYALIGYQTAYLKAHYPAAFLAALMTGDMDNSEKLMTYVFDCKTMGITLEPPDLNQSNHIYKIENPSCIRIGLGAIKGVGAGPAQLMVLEREENGPFTSLLDVCNRVNSTKLNARMIAAMIHAGAMDSLGFTRGTLIANLPEVVKAANQLEANRNSGQSDMFGLSSPQTPAFEMQIHPELPDEEKLFSERKVLGYFLSSHPLKKWSYELNHFALPIADIRKNYPPEKFTRSKRRFDSGKVTVAGVVLSALETDRAAFVEIEDGTGQLTVIMGLDEWSQQSEFFLKDTPAVFEGKLTFSENRNAYLLRNPVFLDMERAKGWYASAIEISAHIPSQDFSENLMQLLEAYTPGSLKTYIHFMNEQGEVRLDISEKLPLRYEPEMIDKLLSFPGIKSVKLYY